MDVHDGPKYCILKTQGIVDHSFIENNSVNNGKYTSLFKKAFTFRSKYLPLGK